MQEKGLLHDLVEMMIEDSGPVDFEPKRLAMAVGVPRPSTVEKLVNGLVRAGKIELIDEKLWAPIAGEIIRERERISRINSTNARGGRKKDEENQRPSQATAKRPPQIEKKIEIEKEMKRGETPHGSPPQNHSHNDVPDDYRAHDFDDWFDQDSSTA